MIFSRRFVWGGLLLAAPALLAATVRQAPTRPAAAAESKAAYKGAIVIDAATGNVLFEDRADTVTPPASMAKLMTFAVVHDKLASGALTLSTPVKIELADAWMGGTQVFLDPRETFPVEVHVEAIDRTGLLRDVSEIFTRERVNVIATNTLTRDMLARMRFTAEIRDLDHLNRVLALLREVKGVVGAARR